VTFSLQNMATSTILFSKKPLHCSHWFFFFGPSSAKILPPKKNTGHNKVFVAFYIAGKQGAQSPTKGKQSLCWGIVIKTF
jgi:hypothetical protein